MAEIKKEVIDNKQITVFRVTGILIFDQIIDEITQFYKGGLTDHTLWDLSEADVKDITYDDVNKIALHSKEFGHLREDGCKTAFVMSTSLGYGLGRMFDSLAQVISHPVQFGVFRNYDEAIFWIEKEKD